MKFNCKTPKELLKKVKNEGIKMVDLRFTDLPGSTHHISIPIKYLTEDLFVRWCWFRWILCKWISIN